MKDIVEHLQAAGLNPIVVDETTNLDMALSNSEIVENSYHEPQSPFLEGTNIQFAWDSTSLGYAKRCAQLYKYNMIDSYQPKGENVHLRFGSEFHWCMAAYQKERAAGIKHEDAIFDVVKELMYRINDWWPDHQYKNRSHLLMAVIAYLDGHEEDPAEVYTMSNGQPAVELSIHFELDYGPTDDQPYVLCGYLDKIVTFNGQLFDVDYKTTTMTPGPYYWKQYDPENQMSFYTFATSVIFPEQGKGVIIDVVQLLLTHPFVRVVRGMVHRTPEQLEEWLVDLQYWIDQAKGWADRNHWPKNDTACDKYGGCPYREVCSATPAIREMILDSDYEKVERWNPLKQR